MMCVRARSSIHRTRTPQKRRVRGPRPGRAQSPFRILSVDSVRVSPTSAAVGLYPGRDGQARYKIAGPLSPVNGGHANWPERRLADTRGGGPRAALGRAPCVGSQGELHRRSGDRGWTRAVFRRACAARGSSLRRKRGFGWDCGSCRPTAGVSNRIPAVPAMGAAREMRSAGRQDFGGDEPTVSRRFVAVSHRGIAFPFHDFGRIRQRWRPGGGSGSSPFRGRRRERCLACAAPGRGDKPVRR